MRLTGEISSGRRFIVLSRRNVEVDVPLMVIGNFLSWKPRLCDKVKRPDVLIAVNIVPVISYACEAPLDTSLLNTKNQMNEKKTRKQ